MRTVIPHVGYRPHDGERSLPCEYKPMRKVGFAPWTGFPRIDDPKQDDETFAQQETRLRDILPLPGDDDDWSDSDDDDATPIRIGIEM